MLCKYLVLKFWTLLWIRFNILIFLWYLVRFLFIFILLSIFIHWHFYWLIYILFFFLLFIVLNLWWLALMNSQICWITLIFLWLIYYYWILNLVDQIEILWMLFKLFLRQLLLRWDLFLIPYFYYRMRFFLTGLL